MNTTGATTAPVRDASKLSEKLQRILSSLRRPKAPAPLSCRWATHFGARELPLATSLVILARPCGCAQDPVGTCSGCVGVLMDALAGGPVATPCQSCGERSGNRIVRVEDLEPTH